MLIPTFGNRLDGIDYVDRPGAYAVIANEDKQIAVIVTGQGYYLPGGGIDPGETAVNALKRELVEEIGYQVSVFEEIGAAVEYIEASGEGKYYQIRSRFYKAQLGMKIGEGIDLDHRLVWLLQEDALKLLSRQSQIWAVRNMVTI